MHDSTAIWLDTPEHAITYGYVTRLFDRERMALAMSKQFRERVLQAQRREEVDALLHAGRHPNLVRALAYLDRAGVVQCFF